MTPRILILPIAAVLITATCVWKINQPPRVKPKNFRFYEKRTAPRFELYDQNSQMVKFERYLGRHRVIVVFFDASAADSDVRLQRLRAEFKKVSGRGDIVVGISGALPQEIRKLGDFPFPLLTDINPNLTGSRYMVHKQWGSYDNSASKPLFNLYVVNRAGRVNYDAGQPVPVADPATAIEQLIRNEYYD